jgi:hypothetical protein
MKKLFLVAMTLIMVAISFAPVSAVYVACTNGSDATIGVNWTFTGASGTMALVSNVGTPSNALLDFTIPTGADGGMNMTPNMTPGSAASITVNYTSTLSPGSPATVTNVGTSSVALLNFGIPRVILEIRRIYLNSCLLMEPAQ